MFSEERDDRHLLMIYPAKLKCRSQQTDASKANLVIWLSD